MSYKAVAIIAAIVVLGALGVTGYFAWQQFQGAAPAFLPPSQDIAKLIPPQGATNDTEFPLELPDGFRISVFAEGFQKPRDLVFDPAGVLLVSDPDAGRVYALPDGNQDNVADEHELLLQGLNRPHGLAVHCSDGCALFVAETNAVRRYRYDPASREATASTKILDLPGDGNHWTRSLHIIETTDGPRLLTAVGSSCNVCAESDPRRAAVTISNLDGTESRLYATGLRNAVFLATHPTTGETWVTEMGRDHLGDDLPPDEVNVLADGGEYGWPHCYGKQTHDGDFDPRSSKDCASSVGSHIDIQAHSAPLGLAFIPEAGWPDDWAGDLIVAYHGSWNRSVPTGYKLVRMELTETGKYVTTHDLITGWLQNGSSLGRPVDVAIDDAGTLYVTDDKAGLVYQVQYQGAQ